MLLFAPFEAFLCLDGVDDVGNDRATHGQRLTFTFGKSRLKYGRLLTCLVRWLHNSLEAVTSAGGAAIRVLLLVTLEVLDNS